MCGLYSKTIKNKVEQLNENLNKELIAYINSGSSRVLATLLYGIDTNCSLLELKRIMMENIKDKEVWTDAYALLHEMHNEEIVKHEKANSRK